MVNNIFIHGCTPTNIDKLSKWSEFNGEDIDLPSSHPYWTIQVLLDDYKSYLILLDKIKECEEDNNKIKFLFNSSTTIEELRLRVKQYEKNNDILKQLNLIK